MADKDMADPERRYPVPFLSDDRPAPAEPEEDAETLAAIEEGIQDADAGRLIPLEEVRQWLREKWTSKSS